MRFPCATIHRLPSNVRFVASEIGTWGREAAPFPVRTGNVERRVRHSFPQNGFAFLSSLKRHREDGPTIACRFTRVVVTARSSAPWGTAKPDRRRVVSRETGAKAAGVEARTSAKPLALTRTTRVRRSSCQREIYRAKDTDVRPFVIRGSAVVAARCDAMTRPQSR